MSPVVNFGEKMPGQRKSYLKLDSKGDKVHIRLLGAPFIEGKHFLTKEDGSWDIKPCPRINEGEECPICEQYFALMAEIKKEPDEATVKQLKKDARSFNASVFVYYPVIDRETEQFAVFQSKASVRNAIEDEFAMGTKVLDVDFLVVRTETPGPNYYKVNRLDSADTKALTKKEKEEAKKYDPDTFAQSVGGRRDEDSGVAIEENSEVVDVEDINSDVPF